MRSKLGFWKRNLVLYSAGLSLILQFPLVAFALWYSGSDLSSSGLVRTFIIGFIQGTILIFPFWLFVRWVASTAEKAGRSYVAFMILGLVAPVIAWIIVILFKKPEETTKTV